MSETKIPGLACKHMIVTPICRANKDVGALDEVIEELRKVYLNLSAAEANAVADFHFVLTVDRLP